MARNMYGATSADFTLTSGGRPVPGAVLTLWTARTGGTQITDLTDVDSVACTTVTSDASGAVVYYGPDTDLSVHWADSGQGARVAIRPVDITGEPPTLTVGTVDSGTAAVVITGDSPDYTLDFTLPPVGTNGVNTAAIQDDAVTADKIAADAVGSSEIAANAVGSSELADNAVDTAAIATGAVTAAKFAVQPGNLLTDNQASGTDTLAATTGFTALYSTLASATSPTPAQGSRSLEVTATATSYAGFNLGGDQSSGTIPVTGGDVYTFRVKMYSAAATDGVTPIIYWWTSAGNVAASTASTVGTEVPLAASWKDLVITATAPANAAYASLRMRADASHASGIVWNADALSFHRGASGTWAMPGIPVPGQSRIAVNNAVDLSGTGTPESVVTAAPGSTWLQTDSTTDVKGWIKWVKATGTGNTGWKAGAEADTGWRDVSASMTSAGTTKYPNGKVAVRRVGSRVECIVYTGASAVDGAAATTIYDLPVGFRTKTLWTYRSVVGAMVDASNGQPATGAGLYIGAGTPLVIGQTATAGAGSTRTGSVTGIADDTTGWPTSLPGVAV